MTMDTKKAVIPVKGMTCVNCAAAIQKDISKLAGVKSANVNYANEKAVVEFDPDAVGLDKFISSINELGYQAVTETVTVPIIDLDASRGAEAALRDLRQGRSQSGVGQWRRRLSSLVGRCHG